MKKIVKQIPIKFGGFYVIKRNLVQTVLSTSIPKYRWKFVYRPIFKRSIIGGPIYYSVSSTRSYFSESWCTLSTHRL